MKINVTTQHICEICSKPFITHYGKRFCSPTCRAKWSNEQRWGSRPKPKCQLCGAPVLNRSGKKMYCSIQCRNTALARRQVKKFTEPKSPRFIWTPEQLAFLRQYYPDYGIDYVAEHLGYPRVVVRNKANGLKIRLNRETGLRVQRVATSERMRHNNPMKQDENKAKVSKWWDENKDAAEQRWHHFLIGKQQSQKDRPSKLEVRLRNILTELGVDFEPSALIKPKFIVDIRINKVIIQADGEYWHGHPRFEPLTERQKQQKRRDAAQDAYLQSCGYKVIRVWERDVTPENISVILRTYGLL